MYIHKLLHEDYNSLHRAEKITKIGYCVKQIWLF